MKNKKGMSLIGLLLAVLIIVILLKLMMAPYKQQATATKPGQPQHIQTQSQAKQTVDNVRAALKQAEKAANEHANYSFENANK